MARSDYATNNLVLSRREHATRLTRWRAKREPCSLVNRRWRCEQVTRLPVEYNYCLIRIISDGYQREVFNEM